MTGSRDVAYQRWLRWQEEVFHTACRVTEDISVLLPCNREEGSLCVRWLLSQKRGGCAQWTHRCVQICLASFFHWFVVWPSSLVLRHPLLPHVLCIPVQSKVGGVPVIGTDSDDLKWNILASSLMDSDGWRSVNVHPPFLWVVVVEWKEVLPRARWWRWWRIWGRQAQA